MTADERAAKITSGWEGSTRSGYTALIADAIRAAVLEEREACAKAAEAAAKKNEYCPPGCKCGNGFHIAAAIRGRE